MAEAPSTLTCFVLGDGALTIQCGDILLDSGHTIRGVITADSDVKHWADQKQLPVLDVESDYLPRLKEKPFDYLFSIINLRMLPKGVVQAATKGTINFHDSPLPRYGGLYPTSWALMKGEQSHGVTWHFINDVVDGGPILKQRMVDIHPAETAYSLLTKCFEAAVGTFEELIRDLAQGSAQPREQDASKRTYFPMWLRAEGAGLIRWSWPATQIESWIRAMDFGTAPNAFGRAKIQVGQEILLCGAAKIIAPQSSQLPGTLLGFDSTSITVATGQGVIQVSQLQHACGRPVSLEEILQSQRLQPNTSVLKDVDPDIVRRITERHAQSCKAESFWVQRLKTIQSPVIPYFETPTPNHGGNSGKSAASTLTLTQQIPAQAFASAKGHGWTPIEYLLTGIGLYLSRIGNEGSFDLAWRSESLQKSIQDTAGLFSDTVPLRCHFELTSTVADCVQVIRTETARVEKSGTFLIDLVTRHGSLKSVMEQGFRKRLPIAVEVGSTRSKADSLPEGVSLLLSLDPDRHTISWVIDLQWLSEANAQRMIRQLATVLEHLPENSQQKAATVPLLSEAERHQVLVGWNATTTDFPSHLCVHQAIEHQVAKTPQAVAVAFRNQQLTYAQLNAKANQLASHLRKLGIGPDSLVGLCVHRSLEMVVGLLAIQKAGGAYLPIDPGYPSERIAHMLEDSGAPVLITESKLSKALPSHKAKTVLIDEDWPTIQKESDSNAESKTQPNHLAYVIYTSGSTGKPKGVMIEHRNVVNFFTGMDQVLGSERPGTWLAVTSVSFDIHVLELSWTLARGFKVVVQEDQAFSVEQAKPTRSRSNRKLDFTLFYFSSDAGEQTGQNKYWLMLEGAKFADSHGFTAVWTPERHFHAFGGLYPNPSLTSAAIAVVTQNVQLRAGSIVLPLHSPLRIAEEWAMVDNLSNGRVGFSFASGWHANDFAFAPENYADRKNVMFRGIDMIRRLWRGETVPAKNGNGDPIQLRTLPTPVRPQPPIWITAAGNIETFRQAGEMGFNLLTNMLGQNFDELTKKIAAYREAWRQHKHPGEGTVSVMLHTFVGDDVEKVRAKVKGPFCDYLKTSFDLIKIAPWAFPAFRQPSQKAGGEVKLDPANFTSEDMDALLDHAFDRYFETAGLFGTPEYALTMVDRLKQMGADEVACLIDFGVPSADVFQSLVHLNRLKEISNAPVAQSAEEEDYSIPSQIRRHQVTHFQCTPSLAAMLASNPDSLESLRSLQKVLLGGEALPRSLADQLQKVLQGDLINMYGPTETTVWSSSCLVPRNGPITIGRPLANTQIYILDKQLQPLPAGVAGELMIGGAGVVRGYHQRPELTRERFIPDPFSSQKEARLYRTGDLARFRADGQIEYISRLDFQVKIRGHRIELGEIEAALNRHPGVRESVVVAREDSPGDQRLVAYVIPRTGAGSDAGSKDKDTASHWQKLWNQTYEGTQDLRTELPDPTFNIIGWNSSYTGTPIPESEMREWVDQTVERILSLKPKKVLEIGCGTGLLLFRVAPHCAHYTGIDFTESAIEHIRSHLRKGHLPQAQVQLRKADELGVFEAGSFDTIVINSVAQYFPGVDYLIRVIEQALKLLTPEGRLFLGDIRSRPLLEAFHTDIELSQAPDDLSIEELRKRIQRRTGRESEMVMDPELFYALPSSFPQIQEVSVQLKRGRAMNEVTRFRYDVVLSRQSKPQAATGSSASDSSVVHLTQPTLDTLQQALQGTKSPGAVWLENVENPRLVGPAAAVASISANNGSAPANVGELRKQLSQLATNRGIHPEDLLKWAETYDIEVTWSSNGSLNTYDAILRHKHQPSKPVGNRKPTVPKPWKEYVNPPLAVGSNGQELVSELGGHLKEKLPTYMLPSAYVVLNAFPLTPNGKIDRKSLPAPDRSRAVESAANYVAPQNDTEKTISKVWQELLRLEQVGSNDNFFDLGANSLLMVQANNLLKQALGRSIPLVDLFRFPTVSTLAAHLSQPDQASGPQLQQSLERGEARKDALSRRRQMRQSLKTP